MSATVGIDLGTSAVKVLLLDEAGRTITKTRAPYPLSHPAADRTEQSLDAWWEAIGEAPNIPVEKAPEPLEELNGLRMHCLVGNPLMFDCRFKQLECLRWLDLGQEDPS